MVRIDKKIIFNAKIKFSKKAVTLVDFVPMPRSKKNYAIYCNLVDIYNNNTLTKKIKIIILARVEGMSTKNL